MLLRVFLFLENTTVSSLLWYISDNVQVACELPLPDAIPPKDVQSIKDTLEPLTASAVIITDDP